MTNFNEMNMTTQQQINDKMIAEMNNFDRMTVAPFDEMLCDEIGAYVHIVSTMRYYAKHNKQFARYVKYNELHEIALQKMTEMYFNNIGESLNYVIENY